MTTKLTPLFKAYAWTSDGRRIAWSDTSGRCEIWDADALISLGGFRLGGSERVIALEFDPDGVRLAFLGSGQDVAVAPVTEGRLRRVYQSDGVEPASLAWSPDATRLAVGRADGTVVVLREGTWEQTLTFQASLSATGFGKPVRAVSWSPDGRSIAVGSHSGCVEIWDAEDGSLVREIQPSGPRLHALAFDARGNHLAIVGAGPTRLWDLSKGEWREMRHEHAEAALCLAFSPDGRNLVVGGMDRVVRIHDVETGVIVRRLRGLNGWIQSLFVDSVTVRAADADGVVGTWQSQSGLLLSRTRFDGPGTPDVEAVTEEASGWRREVGKYEWESLRCGCPRGARHIPQSFAALVAASTPEEADGLGLAGHVETQSMLFESALPVASLAAMALRDENLSEASKWRLMDIVMALVCGESHAVEIEAGRPELEVECQDAIREYADVFRRELSTCSNPGTKERALEILDALGEEAAGA